MSWALKGTGWLAEEGKNSEPRCVWCLYRVAVETRGTGATGRKVGPDDIYESN